jgi:hypothetical protein
MSMRKGTYLSIISAIQLVAGSLQLIHALEG